MRFFSVHGSGLRKQLLWDACCKLARGEREFGGTGEEVRDWLHVDDAAALLHEAVERAGAPPVVVNGGSGVGVRVRDVVEEVACAMGWAGGVHFTGVARPGDPFRFVADVAAARAWGWTPRIGWREGVRAYCQWFREGAQ